MQDDLEIVVGLEVHAQLLTESKLFCSDTNLFGQDANTQVSPVSLAHPGTLPRLNLKAAELAIRLGLALDCEIVRENYFARKNYFYPDLPKGYQISQHTTPICRNGKLEIESDQGKKTIRINRIHMEEDAGKSLHGLYPDQTALDFNRAGTPLVEIVTEPDLRSAEEAHAFVNDLRNLVRELNVCDGNMEEGSLRCDVNISIRKKGDEKLGTKVEIKNLNSLRFIKKAIEFETTRLTECIRSGENIVQETRGFDEENFTSFPIRVKEDEDDYRYFPEPDLPVFHISDEMLNDIRNQMPVMSSEIRNNLINTAGLSEYDAGRLVQIPGAVSYFQELLNEGSSSKSAANWLNGPLKKYFEENRQLPSVKDLSLLIKLTEKGELNFGIASQRILPEIIEQKVEDLESWIREQGFTKSTSGEELDGWIKQALDKHSNKIAEYKKGKKGLISVFVGEVMKLSKGKADPQRATEIINDQLKNN